LIQFTGTNTINGAEMSLTSRSLKNLTGVHPDLVKIVLRTAQESEFVVTEGVRTAMRQAELVKAGASQTMKSRHLTGHAVDLAVLVGGEVRWDWPLYNKLAAVVKAAAAELAVPIEWGGDWKSFKDGPHFQLPWKDYP
jgi:peptidoglycan L-alanyl-D-glutamate endopeptidase CwlK